MNQSTIAIVILIIVIIIFATSIIPIAMTAILASMSMVLTGIISPSEALSFFGNDTVIMVAGTSILASAVFETGLASKFGKICMQWKWAVKNERNALIAMLVITMLLSTIMGNVPVLAIMYPVASVISGESRGCIRKKSLFMAMAIGSTLGGNVTLSGSSCNMLAQGILENTEGVEPLGFFTLARGAIPALFVCILFFAGPGRKLQNRIFEFSETREIFHEEENRTWKKSKAAITAISFCLSITGFVCGFFSIGVTALLGASVCIITGCISFENAMREMDWTTVCVLAGSLGFAKGVNESGAGLVMANALLGLFGGKSADPFIIICALVFIGGLFTNVMQNNAVIAILLPIAITMAQELQGGVNVLPFVCAVIYSSSFACATPIGTAPMTMSLAAGYRFSDYIKIGGLCELLVVIITAITIPVLYPF